MAKKFVKAGGVKPVIRNTQLRVENDDWLRILAMGDRVTAFQNASILPLTSGEVMRKIESQNDFLIDCIRRGMREWINEFDGWDPIAERAKVLPEASEIEELKKRLRELEEKVPADLRKIKP